MTQDYNIDLTPSGIKPVVRISQYDRESRVLSFSIFENGKPYTIPTDATVTLRGTKPDHKGFEYVCTKSGSVVTIPVRVQMSVVAGMVECEIRITKGTTIIGTQNITLMVEKSALADDTDTSESDFPSIETITQSAQNAQHAAKKSEDILKQLENAYGDIKNVTVNANSFTAQSDGSYRASYSNSKIKATDVLTFDFSNTNNAYVVLTKWETFAGGFYLYAFQKPIADIVINRVTYRRENA